MPLPDQNSFAVHEVTFQEQVDVADENYGDALDTFDLGADEQTRPSRTPHLMAQTDADAQTGPTATPAEAAMPAATTRPGLLARLFGWLLGRG